jgi:DNA-binding MarR family transcriptional regulator
MKDEDLLVTALEIRILANILTKLAARSLEQHLQEHGAPINAHQHSILRMLGQRQYTSSELSRKIRLDPATLVPMVDALERHGYAHRGVDPADRRRTPLSLTERGAELLARIPIFDRDDALVTGLMSMGDESARQLLHLLRVLVNHMTPNAELAGELASIAQMAIDVFRTQAELAHTTAQPIPEGAPPDER